MSGTQTGRARYREKHRKPDPDDDERYMRDHELRYWSTAPQVPLERRKELKAEYAVRTTPTGTRARDNAQMAAAYVREAHALRAQRDGLRKLGYHI